jgi:hypothetical protein
MSDYEDRPYRRRENSVESPLGFRGPLPRCSFQRISNTSYMTTSGRRSPTPSATILFSQAHFGDDLSKSRSVGDDHRIRSYRPPDTDGGYSTLGSRWTVSPLRLQRARFGTSAAPPLATHSICAPRYCRDCFLDVGESLPQTP